MQTAIDYLNPDLPAGLARVSMPVIDATSDALKGYGRLVDDPKSCPIEIVRWQAQGTRLVDADTGDQGGTTEGVFVSEWRGDILYGRNEAVGGHYILAYAEPPESSRTDHADPPRRMMLWHANYHPDGGQLFFPLDRRPFYVPLALPGDDVTPQRFVCFRFDGSQGLYIHPNIWHEGVFGLSGTQRFFDSQGAVHARVSVDFAREFGCLLEAVIGNHDASCTRRSSAADMPLIFSYGTLQQEGVQLSTFGRLLQGHKDELSGFEPSRVKIEAPQIVAGGRTHHDNVTFNGRNDSRVSGTVFEISDAELAAADVYERSAGYERIAVTLASGKRAWVYVDARSAPRPK